MVSKVHASCIVQGDMEFLVGADAEPTNEARGFGKVRSASVGSAHCKAGSGARFGSRLGSSRTRCLNGSRERLKKDAVVEGVRWLRKRDSWCMIAMIIAAGTWVSFSTSWTSQYHLGIR